MIRRIMHAQAKRWPQRTIAQRIDHHSIPEPNTGCVLWTGSICSGGYGSIRIDNKTLSAHRVAFEQKYGKIPAGFCACHRCDTRSCVNPDHIFLGTLIENNADRNQKNRNGSAKGSHNGQAILTEELVVSIFYDSRSPTEIAKVYNIGRTTVSGIKNYRSWKHITGELR